MKLVGRSSSKSGNRAQTKKSIINDYELSEAPFDDTGTSDLHDITSDSWDSSDFLDVTQNTVDISELPEIKQFLEQQQPVLTRSTAPKPVVKKETAPATPKPPAPKKVKPPSMPQITAYPDVELSAAQKAAIQRVINKKAPKPEEAPKSEEAHKPEEPQQSAVPTGNTGKIPQQVPQQVQKVAPVKRKANKKRRADIHAHSDRQLKKRGPPVKIFLIVFLIALVLAGGGLYGWYYWWTEHATFEYELHPIVILSGQSVEAYDFITSCEEMDRVAATFQNPDFKPQNGLQHVPLTLSLGLRSVEDSVTLHVMTTKDREFHEYKEPGNDLRAIDFITNLDAAAGVPFVVDFVVPPLKPEEYEVGEHTLYLVLNDAPFEVLYIVADTIPPTARAVSKHIIAGDTVVPTDFVEDVYDHSGIRSIEFVSEPNLLSESDQIVEIEITDNNGISAIFRGELIITLNMEDPVIEGTETIISGIGVDIDESKYLDGVTAFDDMERPLEVIVDSSGVDISTAGVYSVFYTATDATGLSTVIEEKVHIINVDFDDLYARVDDALERIRRDIRKDEITQLDMVRGIHAWVIRHLYLPDSDTVEKPEVVYEAAYRAIIDRRRHYIYYSSLSEIMLTRAGIPNLRIDRIPDAATQYRWNLVNPDEAGWHHYDATPLPHRVSIGAEAAYFKNSRAIEITRRYESFDGTKNFWTFDVALYPEIVT